MKTKALNPVTLIRKKTLPIVEIFFEITHLKQLYRQGWLLRDIPPAQCESVAEHTFGVAILAMLLADSRFPELDQDKLLRMALIHDLGEVYAGDIIPEAGFTLDEKYQLEKESVTRILGKIPNSAKYLSLWEEYEAGESPESRFIRQIDKLEMALQTSVYEHQFDLILEEFNESAKDAIQFVELQEILEELENMRKQE